MIGQWTPNLRASADVLPFRFIDISGQNTGAYATAAGAAIGVSQGSNRAFDDTNHALNGEPIALQPGKIVQVEAGAAISAAAAIEVGSTGLAAPWVTTGVKVAVALEAAADAGEIIRARLTDDVTLV